MTTTQDATPEADARPRVPRTLLHTGVLFAVAVVLFVRRSDAFLNPQLWAEDGAIFLSGQRALGFSSLLAPHAGYAHVVQRLVALAGAGVPLEWVPHFYNYAAFGLLLLSASLILNSRLELPLRLLFPLALVLAPHPGEVLMTLTNVHWVLAPAFALLLIQPAPRSRAVAAAELALVLLLGLSGPFALLFLPLLAYRWRAYGRDRYGTALTGVVLLAAATQGFLLATNLRPSPPASPVFLNWLGAVGYNLPGGLYLGRFLSSVPSTTVVVVTSGLLFAATLYAVSRLPRPERRLATVFLLCGALAYAATLFKFRSDPFLIDNFERGPRYLYVPYVFACWVHLLLLSARGVSRWVGAVGAALIAVASYTYFSIPPMPDWDWKGSVRRYRERGERLMMIHPGWRFDIDRPTPEDQFP